MQPSNAQQKRAEFQVIFNKREQQRTEDLDKMKHQAYLVNGLVALFAICASGSSWYIVLFYSDKLYPYTTLAWIISVSMSVFLVITLCCVYVTIKLENFSMYFFAVFVLCFAVLCAFLAVAGTLIFYTNGSTDFSAVSDDMIKTICIYGFIVSSFGTCASLCVSGIYGLILDSLSQENYFSERKLGFRLCPNFMPDISKWKQERALRKKKKDDTESSDTVDDTANKDTFEGVLNLQCKGETPDDPDRKDYFQLRDLLPTLPDREDRDLQKSIQRCGEYQRSVKGALLPNRQMRFSPDVQLIWGTALALAILHKKLREWAKENKRNLKEMKTAFEKLIEQTSVQLEKDWRNDQERDKAKEQDGDIADADADGVIVVIPEVGEEVGDGEVHANTYDMDANSKHISWYQPVKNAITFLCKALFVLREENPEMKKRNVTAVQWFMVAKIQVKEWFETNAFA